MPPSGSLNPPGHPGERSTRLFSRTLKNHLETFPFFVAAIFIITATSIHNGLTVWGANLYFWGRLVYALLYAADFPLARSITWNIPTIGIVMIVAALWLK